MAYKDDRKSITFFVPPELKTLLQEEGKKTDRSLTQMLNHIIKEYFKAIQEQNQSNSQTEKNT